jgi:hypothetical protein
MANRVALFAVSISLLACQAQPRSEASGPVPGPGKLYLPGSDKGIDVEIVSSREINPAPIEASSLGVTGVPDTDRGLAFWQVGISSRGIVLQGAVSTRPPEMVKLPPVKSTITTNTETWITSDAGTKIRIAARRERCVRQDGFVFLNQVTVQIGDHTLTSCGKRGSDSSAVRK